MFEVPHTSSEKPWADLSSSVHSPKHPLPTLCSQSPSIPTHHYKYFSTSLAQLNQVLLKHISSHKSLRTSSALFRIPHLSPLSILHLLRPGPPGTTPPSLPSLSLHLSVSLALPLSSLSVSLPLFSCPTISLSQLLSVSLFPPPPPLIMSPSLSVCLSPVFPFPLHFPSFLYKTT